MINHCGEAHNKHAPTHQDVSTTCQGRVTKWHIQPNCTHGLQMNIQANRQTHLCQRTLGVQRFPSDAPPMMWLLVKRVSPPTKPCPLRAACLDGMARTKMMQRREAASVSTRMSVPRMLLPRCHNAHRLAPPRASAHITLLCWDHFGARTRGPSPVFREPSTYKH